MTQLPVYATVALSHKMEAAVDYSDAVARIVSVHREEIEADLAKARLLRERVVSDLTDAERRVARLESLLGFVRNTEDGPAPTGRTTLHAAMRKVLESSVAGMMRAGDLAAEIERRGLYRMRDGRPVEAQQIHARVGHYPDDFTREGTFIKLVDRGQPGGPAGG